MNQGREQRSKRESKREVEPPYATRVSRLPRSHVAIVASNGSKFRRRVQQILLLLAYIRYSGHHSVGLVRGGSVRSEG